MQVPKDLPVWTEVSEGPRRRSLEPCLTANRDVFKARVCESRKRLHSRKKRQLQKLHVFSHPVLRQVKQLPVAVQLKFGVRDCDKWPKMNMMEPP